MVPIRVREGQANGKVRERGGTNQSERETDKQKGEGEGWYQSE